MPWTKERLQEALSQRLDGTKLVVVANREPYIHTYEGREIRCMRPASGLTTAIDPVMQACGGVWIAHGSGTADREVVDEHDRVQVPEADPRYCLRRVWLDKKEEQGYYYGFSNDAMWPLCHVAYARPRFDSDDWRQYRKVNEKFAEAVLEEIGDEQALVFVQDYHFALLPQMLKEARDDLVVAQFWHIPWPNREVFRVCPWHDEILEGLLGNDLLCFHIQYHCNNFLDTIDRSLEAKVDMEHFSVTRGGHTTRVRPFPISIDPEAFAAFLPLRLEEAERRVRAKLGLTDERILVGVDRVDYTKGIPERFAAVESLLQRYPAVKGTFTLVQVGAPSRTHLPIYQRLNEQLSATAEGINRRHGQGRWRPIIFLNEHHNPWEICALFRLAAGCVVSSLHDGMNLVAKEFIASRTDLQGVLVLSRFTGAARELPDALLINPYATDDFADAMHAALTMPSDEQKRRMTRMRRNVEDNNIYRWAGMLLSEAGKMIRVQQPLGAYV
jgi:alpha,alpha-trehalose-phosphate synthase [UDP-forming]